MKTYWFIRCLTSVVVPFTVFAQDVLEQKYPTYVVTAVARPRSAEETRTAPLLIARQPALKGKELRPFGIFLRDKSESAGIQTVLEIIDAQKNASIKKISVDELFGKEAQGWQVLAAESKNSSGQIVTAFRLRTGAYNFKLVREIAIAEDRNLPLGKKITVTFLVESAAALTLRAKFSAVAEGTSRTAGTSLLISESDTLSRVHPTLIVHPLQGGAIDLARPLKKGASPRFAMTTKGVHVAANAPTPIFALEVSGTSISSKEYVERQATNVRSYFDTRIGKPDVVVVTQPSKASSQPGDTLQIVLHSHNIGTAPAKDNSLNNIIPSGSIYVEGSAEGKGSEIVLTGTDAQPPQRSMVTNITWKYKDLMYPGQELIASFKVLVR